MGQVYARHEAALDHAAEMVREPALFHWVAWPNSNIRWRPSGASERRTQHLEVSLRQTVVELHLSSEAPQPLAIASTRSRARPSPHVRRATTSSSMPPSYRRNS